LPVLAGGSFEDLVNDRPQRFGNHGRVEAAGDNVVKDQLVRGIGGGIVT
jgi:hypothetical protein